MTTDAIGRPAERSIPKQFVWPPKYYESSFHKYIVLVFYTCDWIVVILDNLFSLDSQRSF
jgi:hypothetical protein